MTTFAGGRIRRPIPHPSVSERMSSGQTAREQIPPSRHAGWLPAANRADPVGLLVAQNLTRAQDLVPIRHGRMMLSPFTFYRGAAKLMADDLALTPTSGLIVQLCGDAHLSNFGAFASPERRLVFDLNDFDETLPGPFEYDVKRMAASFTIAARNNGMSKAEARVATVVSIRSYREAMVEFAGMRTMDIWYASMSADDLESALTKARGPRMKAAEAAITESKLKDKKEKSSKNKPVKHKRATTKAKATSSVAPLDADQLRAVKTAKKTITKAHTRDSLQALTKLAELVGERYRIIHAPPVIVPFREMEQAEQWMPVQIEMLLRDQFHQYRASLQSDRRHLLERFEVIDVARKVVGVGSVGTRAFIVLLQGRDAEDPLFLQVKEATRSVLEDYLPKSRYAQGGERVVQGQRGMQAA